MSSGDNGGGEPVVLGSFFFLGSMVEEKGVLNIVCRGVNVV
jgi:hypothetical protein